MQASGKARDETTNELIARLERGEAMPASQKYLGV